LGVEPELVPGSGGIFDVRVDDDLVYSKHETGSFPIENELIDDIRSRP